MSLQSLFEAFINNCHNIESGIDLSTSNSWLYDFNSNYSIDQCCEVYIAVLSQLLHGHSNSMNTNFIVRNII